MQLDQELRDQLTEATRDVVGGPDLRTSIEAGRRQRTTRTALLGGGAAAAVVAVTFGVASVLSGPAGSPDPGRTSPDVVAPAADPGPADFVAGTTVDESLQETIASHLSALPAADDVYPSDWNHDGPMPEAQFANATDWQAYYTVDPSQTFRVIAGYLEHASDGGELGQVETSHYTSGGLFTFNTSFTTQDGFLVNASERISAPSLAAANQARSLSSGDIAALVQDPALTFPEPVDWPN
jgi:hypothetical protein